MYFLEVFHCLALSDRRPRHGRIFPCGKSSKRANDRKRATERECLATIPRRVCCDHGRLAA